MRYEITANVAGEPLRELSGHIEEKRMSEYLKFTDPGGEPTRGEGAWSLPVKNADGSWTPGESRDVEGELIPCEHAIHACKEHDTPRWVAAELYAIEFADEPTVHDDTKVYGRKARLLYRYEAWNERTMRLFAVDCAEHVLHIFEEKYPDDTRPRKAIEAARAYLAGEIDETELENASEAKDVPWVSRVRWSAWASWAAAWSARSAAWAARDARDSGDARTAIWAAASDARDAAGDNAGDAKDAAEAAERAWQAGRLMEYARGER